ncbi:MAG: hypothetical protein ACLPX9_07695 [Rhodomicrobium sp.]
MRAFLLFVFEIAAVFGIPRIVNEFRAAHEGKAPPTILVVGPVKESQPVTVARPKAAAAAPKAPAAAKKPVFVRIVQVSVPSGMAAGTLQPVPQADAPATPAKSLGVSAKTAVEESAAPPREDDYLPPWMRGAAAAKPDASAAVADAKPSPEARVLRHALRHKRHRRQEEMGWDSYAGNSRRNRRSAYNWSDF